MIERVIFTSEADDDVAASYDWYESREPGLGEEFLRSIEACVRGIQRNPEMYPVSIDEFRCAPLRRFPFEIFYELTGNGERIHFNLSVASVSLTRELKFCPISKAGLRLNPQLKELQCLNFSQTLLH